MSEADLGLRRTIIDQCRWMNASGLNQGTSGNISARTGDVMLITPSAVPYEEMKPRMIAAMPLEGDYGFWAGPLNPSVEWRFHRHKPYRGDGRLKPDSSPKFAIEMTAWNGSRNAPKV